MTASLAEALAAAPIPLDGGLGTRLAARGNDVTGELWSAEILRNDPAEVRAAHVDFFAAGARVATTCSYQVSYEGFARIGVDEAEVDRLLLRSVDVAREAREEAGLAPDDAWILASAGPYGAALADGSEYTGDYGADVDELRRWHRRRLGVLASAAPDALLCETIPSLDEVRALSIELAELGAPSIMSFTVSGGALRSGDSIADAARLADQTPGLLAVGVNCSDAVDATTALRLMRAVTELPLIVYPNSGEEWDARSRSWSGSAAPLDARVPEWAAAGARLIGGCCRVDTAEISAVSAAVRALAA
ncbi:homocysteine S-methyltransferase [Leucobacter ruminantium]|uniref:Homocysteine S-methyltransferase n=1 Tax=Leucobacter ruminantium TaxID=1289170 RepID=A0A939LXF8_9MICO|nr:homocysteine S-methyltransferase [Leucobacter ruminantium]